jgi:hypothetical protein
MNHTADYSLIVWSVPTGALLGLLFLVLERTLVHLKNSMFPRMGNILTAFVLFFVHMITYLALSSIVLNYTVVRFIISNSENMSGLAGKYSLFSVNFFIILALLSWFRNVRAFPHPCF